MTDCPLFYCVVKEIYKNDSEKSSERSARDASANRVCPFIMKAVLPVVYFRILNGGVHFHFWVFTKRRMNKDDFRCIECNEKSSELHRDYSNGILKITICVRSLYLSEFMLCYAIAINTICLPGTACYVNVAYYRYFSKICIDYTWFLTFNGMG